MEKRKTTLADLENKKATSKAIGFCVVLALVLSALSWTSYDITQRSGLVFDQDFIEDEIIPQSQVTPPPPPPPPPATTVVEIVEDDEEIEEELEVEELELDEDTEIEEIEYEEEEEFDDTPFMAVENMPALGPCKELRGEERDKCTSKEIVTFISQNTKYPPIARDAGIQGKVYVKFVVDRKGEVIDAEVMRPVDSRLDKEALRVVNDLPKFEPGEQQGKKVNVQYVIPVNFVIK
ncbi:MAG: energy transducer TonB [Flavobacteriales bacterium]|nr:energy transducer TonB [Flavobacteriales bacterium]